MGRPTSEFAFPTIWFCSRKIFIEILPIPVYDVTGGSQNYLAKTLYTCRMLFIFIVTQECVYGELLS